jgi:MFS transporter, DHA1 family, tetracycline resistance protein
LCESVTGFLTNLLPVLGELGLLMAGGLSFILSFLIMTAYGRKWSSAAVGVGARVYD